MGHEGFQRPVSRTKIFLPVKFNNRLTTYLVNLIIHAKRYLQKGFSSLFAKSEVKRLLDY